MRTRKECGYSLVELLLVVAMLALIAAVATPGISADDQVKLERAATEVAAALRFARSEALRTGTGHGLTISHVTQKVTVRKYDLTTTPISALDTLMHPVSKQPYDFNVNTGAATAGVTIDNSSDIFEYEVVGRRRSLIFDASGTPVWIMSSGPAAYLLIDGSVELNYEDQMRYVRVSPVTGRVTIE